MKKSPLLLMLAVLHLCGTAALARPGIPGAEPGHSEGPQSTGLTAAQCSPRVPLSTRGRYIVDRCGERFKLKSVNWFGASDQLEVVGGLDKQKLSDLVTGMKALGFNSVRLPFSNNMLHPDDNKPAAQRCQEKYGVTCIDPTKNPELLNKTALEVYDAVVAELTRQGLVVILNNHTTKSMWCCGWDGNGFWDSSQALQRWQDDWVMLAGRYQGNKWVAGADLRNEVRPDGLDSPNWGMRNQHDWHMAAQTMGNLLLRMNPDLLIVVEAVNWWGLLDGARPQLKPVRQRPVALLRGDKLVYAVHNYGYTGPNQSGGSLGSGPKYSDMDKATLYSTLDQEWGFVLAANQAYTAPVWMSEFGVGYNEQAANSRAWFSNLADYLIDKDVDWAYWAMNAAKLQNSVQGEDETYGLWIYPDWSGVRSGDWRLGTGPLGRLLGADGRTGAVDATRFLPMTVLLKDGSSTYYVDNNSLDVDWHSGKAKVSCPRGYRVVGVSANFSILCTNAGAVPAQQGTGNYQTVTQEVSPLRYPGDWASQSIKFECPTGSYAVGVSTANPFLLETAGLLCEQNTGGLPLNSRSAKNFWGGDQRASSSGGDWSVSQYKGQCADNQYIIGLAHRRSGLADYPSVVLCSN
ncbi:cellulase family glycosylhydrolase [Stigmatella sp. ncwal1]|uniref:Cellulase family glycosylhydrolase n=1 Tax=Stigmatella ashevillensis TaxID=2995309 RepID=A0ABT5D721_9BACT|nr:cellulase family glycosylhydrolase [Stigmatella ashevillena]MDC0709356.1 cellulase family glycosylhydrolase [Stigmatella ashevillena]